MKDIERHPLKWQEAKKLGGFEGLKLMLQYYTLDPTFENYGDFIKPVNLFHYRKDKRKDITKKYTLLGNFLNVSFVFNSFNHDELTEKQYKELKKLIDKNKASEEYQKAKKDLFNAVCIETTYYTDTETCDTWYINSYSKKYYSLNDVNSNEFQKELENAKKEAEKRIGRHSERLGTIEAFDVRPYYKEIHYLNNEFNELFNLLGGNSGGVSANTKIHQAQRRSIEEVNKNDFKQITLKSSKRKLLYNNTTYSMQWVELEPIVNYQL